ncbi:MAG: hypothetical protein ACI9OJ_005159 [Myxococcota bacterium]|jgi:hypothetical protein
MGFRLKGTTRLIPAVVVAGLMLTTVGQAIAKPTPPRRAALIIEPARPKDAPQVGELTQLMEAELARRGIVRGRLLGSFDTMGLATGRRQLDVARAMLAADHDVKDPEAIEGAFMSALLNLKSSLGSVRVAELVETYLGLAATRLAQQDERLSREYLITALNLDSSLDDKSFFGARTLRERFRQVRAAHTARGADDVGAVKLKSSPSGAEVYVSDRLMGYTPMTLSGLAPGTQLIRLRREGYYEHGFLAAVAVNRTVELRHSLKPMGGRAKLSKWMKLLEKKRSWKKPVVVTEAARGVARLLRVSDVIVAKVRRTRTGYRLTGALMPRGQAPQRLDLEIPLDATLLDRVRSLLARAVPAAVRPVPPKPKTDTVPAP